MGQRVLSVRHGNEPKDDRATAWLTRSGYFVDTRHPYAGDKLGEPGDDLAATIIYGGPFNVYETDRHPFLREEYRWIDACMAKGIKVLGICQGAQMIAHHLGAWAGAPANDVFEFGYYEISPTEAGAGFLDAPMTVCQSHFHTFDLPSGAVHLARGENYENQAYRYGKTTYGFQFHPEVTKTGFRRWQDQNSDVYEKRGVQSREEQNRLIALHDARQGEWFGKFLQDFIGRAA